MTSWNVTRGAAQCYELAARALRERGTGGGLTAMALGKLAEGEPDEAQFRAVVRRAGFDAEREARAVLAPATAPSERLGAAFAAVIDRCAAAALEVLGRCRHCGNPVPDYIDGGCPAGPRQDGGVCEPEHDPARLVEAIVAAFHALTPAAPAEETVLAAAERRAVAAEQALKAALGELRVHRLPRPPNELEPAEDEPNRYRVQDAGDGWALLRRPPLVLDRSAGLDLVAHVVAVLGLAPEEIAEGASAAHVRLEAGAE